VEEREGAITPTNHATATDATPASPMECRSGGKKPWSLPAGSSPCAGHQPEYCEEIPGCG